MAPSGLGRMGTWNAIWHDEEGESTEEIKIDVKYQRVKLCYLYLQPILGYKTKLKHKEIFSLKMIWITEIALA